MLNPLKNLWILIRITESLSWICCNMKLKYNTDIIIIPEFHVATDSWQRFGDSNQNSKIPTGLSQAQNWMHLWYILKITINMTAGYSSRIQVLGCWKFVIRTWLRPFRTHGCTWKLQYTYSFSDHLDGFSNVKEITSRHFEKEHPITDVGSPNLICHKIGQPQT